MVTIILVIVLVGVLLYVVNAVIPMDPRVRILLQVVVVVLLVLWLLDAFGLYTFPVRVRR